jgi:hypothetical protein
MDDFQGIRFFGAQGYGGKYEKGFTIINMYREFLRHLHGYHAIWYNQT